MDIDAGADEVETPLPLAGSLQCLAAAWKYAGADTVEAHGQALAEALAAVLASGGLEFEFKLSQN